jgi:membrane fusion protein (multidrug efflux system)
MSQSGTVARNPAPAAGAPAAGAPAATRGKAAIRRANLARLLRPILMVGGVLIVVVASAAIWLAGGRYASSDDTYVDAAKVSLSTDVSGLVGQVFVRDNQHVVAGQPLFALDQASFETAVADARAQLGQAALDVASAKRGYAEALDEVATQKVQIADDQSNLARYASVVGNGGVTRAVYDDARYKLQGDEAKLGELTDQGGVQLAKLAGNAEIAVGDVPEYQRAEAQLQDAERDLADSVVKAPFSGTVSQTEQLQPGMFLPAGTAAFGLVSDSDVWITAQPKESDLTWVRPGQAATVTVDTYPGQSWKGVVESISPASGSEFSILPAQNSSGNWVKVVQRIPVRIKITSGPANMPLRDGMSTEVSIDTGHHRHLSDLF